MRIWIRLFGLAAVTALGGPTRADDLLFGPPPLGRAERAQAASSSFEAGRARDSETGNRTLPAPPIPTVGDAVPGRLPYVSGSPATELNRPAPIAKGPATEPATDRAPARLPDDLRYSPSADLLPAAPPPGPGYAIIDDRLPQPSCPLPGPVYDLGDECGSDCLAWGEPFLNALPCRQCKPFRLFDLPELHFHRIRMGGWLDQGVTLNAVRPANRFNGPVTFNDREAEYQANQLYLFAERVAGRGFGFDVGGRVDVLYGTDHRYTVSTGLEDEWNSDHRFYGLSVPQAYLDVAWNDLTVRAGHFYTIIGYETVTAPDNFFYSHTYSMQYGEPFTHTGLLGIYDLGDCWTICAGLHRGWNRWEDNNDDLGLLGGLSWTSPDEKASVAFALTASNEDDAGENNRFLYSLVCQLQLTKRLKYVLHHDLGYEDDGDDLGPVVEDANWYGFVNYLLYQLNPCWSVGVRHEWFFDDDGARVTHLNSTGGPPKGMFIPRVPQHYQALTGGLNWKPTANLLLRTECRWDWTTPLVPVEGGLFNDYQDRGQFLWGTDLIVTF